MKAQRTLLALVTLGLLSLLTGCTTQTSRDSSVPWNRPANWEGGVPGMGSPDEGRR